MRLYTAKEKAELIGLHVKTVQRLGREGKMPCVMYGGVRRYYPPEEDERRMRSAKAVAGNNAG